MGNTSMRYNTERLKNRIRIATRIGYEKEKGHGGHSWQVLGQNKQPYEKVINEEFKAFQEKTALRKKSNSSLEPKKERKMTAPPNPPPIRVLSASDIWTQY